MKKSRMSFYCLFFVVFLYQLPAVFTNSTGISKSDLNNVRSDNNISIEEFVKKMNDVYLETQRSISEASWNYELTREHQFLDEKDKIMTRYEKIIEDGSNQMKIFQPKIKHIEDRHLKKQLEKISHLITATLPTDLRKEMNNALSQINKQYATLMVSKKEQDIDDIKSTMRDTRSHLLLKDIFYEFQKEITKKIEPQFIKYSSLLEKISDNRGLHSPLDALSQLEGVSLQNLGKDGWKLMEKLYPLLSQLHYYFEIMLPIDTLYESSIPDWWPIEIQYLDIIHPNHPAFRPDPPDKDDILRIIKKNSDLIDWANNYYSIMGFEPLNASKITKLESKTSNKEEMVVFNFMNGDYRLLWTHVRPIEDMKNIFHGMAIIHNLIQFKNHPPVLQDWPNEIFQHAIAGAAALSALSQSYLTKSSKLGRPVNITKNGILNWQMRNILEIIIPGALPLGVITDITIQEIYEGKYTLEKSKRKWWNKIKQFLRIDRPRIYQDGSYENDMDTKEFGPGIVRNMMHASKNIKAFLGEILKYQFFQELCILADQFNPKDPGEKQLSQCDITSGNNKKAIDKLKAVMQLGNTFSWEETIRVMTGKKVFDIQPMFNYYLPLINWLNEKVPYKPVEELLAKGTTKAGKYLGYGLHIIFPPGKC